MKRVRLAIAILALGLILGCASPPAVDIEAERAAIEQLLNDQLAGTNQPGAAGADGYVAVAADDIVVLPPNEPRIDGRDAVRDWALQTTSSEGWSVSWTPSEIEVAASGDLAHAIGTYETSLIDADGNAVSDQGKFFDAFAKQPDGSWKMTVISFSSNLPLPGEPAPEE